jgi:hypothetical protein
MTGSLLYQRQYSSTEGNSNITKMAQLRRCSSVDNRSIKAILDGNQYKDKMFMKHERTPSDTDSGTEDLDQQIVDLVCSETSNVNEEQSSPIFTACADEGFEETFSQVKIEEFQYSPEEFVQGIQNDRKYYLLRMSHQSLSYRLLF